MSYETFFSLNLDLDDKLVPHVCTTSGTDMGALGYTTLDFQINGHSFTQKFIVCQKQTRPLILGQDFCIHYHTSCDWSEPPFKKNKVRGKLIIKVEEPEASKYISVRKSMKIPPRHYAATHLWCKKPKGPVTIKPAQVFAREYPSTWMDTFYMDPNHNKVAASTPLTTNTQVNSSQSTNVDLKSNLAHSGPDEGSTDTLQGSVPPTGAKICVPTHKEEPDGAPCMDVEEVQTEVSCEEILSNNGLDTSLQSTGDFIKIPYDIHNLTIHGPIYIPKGTVIAYADDEEPEMDCFKIAETYEEAQETMQYRNHLPKHPLLPVLLKSDIICSPAEVKFHQQVELKDHDATEETKQHFEELWQQFPEVFLTSNKNIGRTNLITMNTDTGDSLPSMKKPYTLPLKHYDWVQQEIESLEQAGIITRSVSPWASAIVVVPKKSAPGEAPRRRMCIDFHAVNALQPKVVKADSKAKGNFTLHLLPNIDQLYAQLREAKVFSTLDLRSG